MSTKNKKSNCDKNQKLKLWQSSTTLVFTRLINFNWNKIKKKQILKRKQNSKNYNSKKKILKILNFFNRLKNL